MAITSRLSDRAIQHISKREFGENTPSKLDIRRIRNVYKSKLPGQKRREGGQLIVHRYKKAIWRFSDMVEEGNLKNKLPGNMRRIRKVRNVYKNAFRNSDLSDLAIVTVHNYDEKSLFEQNLDFLGVEDYTVLKHSGEWKMTHKYVYLLEFIEECKKPYILFCDARDTVFIDDPAKIVPAFKKFKCEVLFNSTLSARGIFKSYEWTAPLYWWTRGIIGLGWRKRYPNAGVFIGKVEFVKEIAETILFYCERMGCRYPPNSDQDVLRSIYPWYWPRMLIDCYNYLIYRN